VGNHNIEKGKWGKTPGKGNKHNINAGRSQGGDGDIAKVGVPTPIEGGGNSSKKE